MTWAGFFWRYLSYRADLFVALLVCSVIVAAAELSVPWLIARAIDTALGEKTGATLDVWVLWMLAILCGVYLMHALLLRIEARALLGSAYDLKRRLYTHIHTQPLPFFQRNKTGKLMHRVTSDAAVFDEGAYEIFSDLPFSLLTVFGVLALMAFLDPRLMGLIVLFLLLTSVLTGYLGRPLPTIRKSIQRIGSGLSGRLQESLVGVRTVKAFGNEKDELRRLDEANREILDTSLRGGRVESLISPLFDLMEILGVVLIVWYGGHLILDQQLSPGGLVAFIAYMEILAGPISRAGDYYRHFQSCRAVAERLQDLLDDRAPMPPSGSARPSQPRWPLEVEGLSFCYPGKSRRVVDSVSFRVEPGTRVAIVGPNGAGKSTLVDLLARFYAPSAGHILAAGINLDDWDLEAWRARVGVMSQEAFLFQGTIEQNVGYARPGATREQIEAAIEAAGARPLIKRLADGLDTAVGERGSALSGGERQLVAFARLFLRDPEIVILDEPTTHLDGEVLQRVTEAMLRLVKGRTAFVIAHREETVRIADRVLFLDGGRLLADATHDSLMRDNAQYQALFAGERGAAAGEQSDAPARARSASLRGTGNAG